MIEYFWKIPIKLGDPVSTNDGFTGKVNAIEKDVIIVQYDAPIEILRKLGRRKKEGYPFEGLTLIK